MLSVQPKTRMVELTRATMISGERREVGARLDLPFGLASELIHARKAVPAAVVEKTELPPLVDAPPAKVEPQAKGKS